MSAFEQNIINAHGEHGKKWLQDLPMIIQDISAHWNLSDLKPVINLSYNYVLSGYQNNQPVILKLSIDSNDLRKEINALNAFQGFGVVKLLAEDLSQGAMLIERAVPGITLKTLFPEEDSKAINIACQLIEKIHQAPISADNQFPSLATWLQTLDKNWHIPNNYLAHARSLKNDLLKSTCAPVLLHGDLHHDNILLNGNDWIFIDPKGVVGDPIYDKVGCLIREPLAEFLCRKDQLVILQNRVNLIANYFNLDTKRIIDWTFVQTVMAICWCLEDQHDPQIFIRFLEILEQIM